jgi:hypothetical protein
MRMRGDATNGDVVYAGLEVLTAVTINSTIFWVVTPCSLVKFTDFS